MISSDDRDLYETIELLRHRPQTAHGRWTEVRHRGRIYVLELHYSRPDPNAGTPAPKRKRDTHV